jgi:putative redox protein
MSREKVEFSNGRGERLAALLELPDRPPIAFALFAHCFTCGKDIAAAARIARGLTAQGIGVLRFDFTGLGGSEGEFANTNFSSNVEDLLAAAAYLRDEHIAPSLLIGHSLGGTAVLYAAGSIPEVKAVVTVGAPASPAHVIRQFGARIDEIDRTASAEVTLGGRSFRVSRQFLEDLEGMRRVRSFRRPGTRRASYPSMEPITC